MKTTLKIIILTILLLDTIFLFGQERITLSLLQDGKMAFVGDDKGNDPYTMNVVGRIGLEGNDTDIGYAAAILEYEFADLKGGEYHRWSAGYQLNGYVKAFTVSASAQFGVIARGNALPFTGVGNLELTYNAFDWLGFTLSNQWTVRSDLADKPIRYSLMAGVKVKVLDTKNKVGTRF